MGLEILWEILLRCFKYISLLPLLLLLVAEVESASPPDELQLLLSINK